MHQTSKMTIYDAGREINSYFGKEVCHEGNLVNNIAERANTATTTHIVALMDAILANRIQSNSNVVFGITGSGVNIGTAIYTLDDLPDRLRRAATGAWQPEKVQAPRDVGATARVARSSPPLATLSGGEVIAQVSPPRPRRVRVAGLGTVPLQAERGATLEL